VTARVAIVGRAATTALGDDLAATWEAFRSGRSALAPWPSGVGWDARPPRCARLDDDRPLGEDDATRRVLGPHGRWLERVTRAVHDVAGFVSLPREALGMYVAFGMVDAAPEDLSAAVLASRGEDGELDLARFYDGGFRAMHPLWPLSMLANVAAGHLAIALDVRGDNTVLGSDSVAGVRVLLEARRALLTGAAQAALVGAAAEPVSESTLARRRLAGRPLGRLPSEGVGPGEGAVALALETADSAHARGATVQGWLAGAATAWAGDGGPASEALGGAVRRATADALAEAGLARDACDVALLVGPWALPAHAEVLRDVGEVLGRAGLPLARVVSTAEATGDLLGAGALLGAALALELFASGEAPAARTTWRLPDPVPASSPRPASSLGPPRPPPPAPLRRALVLLLDAHGCGALALEAPACAS
jgi:3-oxoacyl-(acyl-carrier-protein) synthase